MAQSGYTPIQLYYSSTATNVPLAANLAAGELAINTVDEKLYFKNSSGVVKLLASTASSVNVSTISFGSTGLTPSSATSGAVSVAGTLVVGNGGTGATSFTSGSLLKGNGTSAIAVASASDIVSAIGTTAVTNATNATNATQITNSGGWSITPSGTNLYFNYNGTNVGKLDSSGNLSVLGNVTAYATGPL